jgi:hypothetical protein
MLNLVRHRLQTFLAAGGAMLAICAMLMLSSPVGAKASESVYCWGASLGNHGRCVGAFRNLNAVYGQGTYQAVCVWASYLANGSGVVGGTTCSTGAAPAATYNNKMIEGGFYPTIENASTGGNTVYGLAFKP